LAEKLSGESARWNWLESLMARIPANYLLVSYLLFVLLFAIYIQFSREVFLFRWIISTKYLLYDTRLIVQSLAQSFLIPFLFVGIVYLSRKTRETFRYIDMLHGSQDNYYYNRIQSRVTDACGYHLLILLSLIIPFLMMSWGRWDYHLREEGYWAWGLDIFNYLLSFLILALLTELLWLMANIVWSVNEIGCVSEASSMTIDVFGIGIKMRPLRNFFLIFIVYYFMAIALIIGTYASPSGRITLEPIYFIVLLILGGILFIAGLEAIQRIINCRIEVELEVLNKRRNEQHHMLLKAVSGDECTKKAAEIEFISRVLNIIQNDRENLMQVNRRAYDIASLSLFMSSFLIPLLTLLEKFGLLHY
jgi:hypothetical protein